MKKIILKIFISLLLFNIATVNADGFRDLCSSIGDTVLSNLEVTKFYGFYDDVGFEYITPAASSVNGHNRLRISQITTLNSLKDLDLLDNEFNILRDALKSHNFIDACVDNTGFVAVQESSTDELIE